MSAGPVGVVLAGGAGRRMGGAKATVEWRGRPLLCYPVDALRAVLGEVAVVCKEDTVLPALAPEVAVWCDTDEARHPLVGVVTALQAARGRSVVVCAGDMPFVTPEVIGALAEAPADAGAVVARAAGRLQPLLARYSPAVLGAIERRDPDAPATRVVEGLAPLVVEVDERVAFNVNAPEDLLLADEP